MGKATTTITTDSGTYRFGNCVVDSNRREVTLGGSVVSVQPKALDLLLYLIEHRDRAVGKDELQDKIWPHTIVTEASLTRCVMKARRAVDDDPQHPEIIKTVRGHGYRFVADIEDELVVEPPPPSSGQNPSIAILPFADLSPDKDQQYLCDGMAEELINSLSRLAGVKVAGRTSTFGLQNTNTFDIGSKLGVAYVLEGSMQRQGEELNLRLHLVATDTGYQVWSEKYRRTLDDVFAIQEDIAENVVRSIAPQLQPGEVLKVPAKTDFEAYDYYLRGLQFTHRFSKRGNLLAIEMFEKALALDELYVPARTGVAISHALIYQWFDPDEGHRNAARHHSDIAIQHDPESPQAFLARGVVRTVAHDYAGAEEAFATAGSLDPNLYEAYYLHGRVCAGQGKNAQAVELFRRGADIRSDEHQCRYLAAQCYDGLGLKDKKREWARKALDVIEPLLELNPDNTRALYHGSGALQYLGDNERGLAWTDRSLVLAPDDPITVYAGACQYAKAGDTERAFEILAGLDVKGSWWYDWLRHDPTVDALRDDPRFEELMARIAGD